MNSSFIFIMWTLSPLLVFSGQSNTYQNVNKAKNLAGKRFVLDDMKSSNQNIFDDNFLYAIENLSLASAKPFTSNDSTESKLINRQSLQTLSRFSSNPTVRNNLSLLKSNLKFYNCVYM